MAKKIEMFISDHDGTIYEKESEAIWHDAIAPLRSLLEKQWEADVVSHMLKFLTSQKHGGQVIDMLVKIRELPNG